jgi:hypothetical protein
VNFGNPYTKDYDFCAFSCCRLQLVGPPKSLISIFSNLSNPTFCYFYILNKLKDVDIIFPYKFWWTEIAGVVILLRSRKRSTSKFGCTVLFRLFCFCVKCKKQTFLRKISGAQKFITKCAKSHSSLSKKIVLANFGEQEKMNYYVVICPKKRYCKYHFNKFI